MHLLCLLMSPRGTVSDVLSRKSSSQGIWLDCANRCWFWLAGLNSLALQILDVTHGAHLRFKSFGFDALQQLELARSEGDSWGLWHLLVIPGHACRGAPAGMLELSCALARQRCSPHHLPVLGALLFGPTPSFFFFFPLQEQIYEQAFPVPSPPPFSGFPATAVTACTEMQVIRLTPASFAWWAGLENWSDKSTCKLCPIFLQGLQYLVLEMLSLGSH